MVGWLKPKLSELGIIGLGCVKPICVSMAVGNLRTPVIRHAEVVLGGFARVESMDVTSRDGTVVGGRSDYQIED